MKSDVMAARAQEMQRPPKIVGRQFGSVQISTALNWGQILKAKALLGDLGLLWRGTAGTVPRARTWVRALIQSSEKMSHKSCILIDVRAHPVTDQRKSKFRKMLCRK